MNGRKARHKTLLNLLLKDRKTMDVLAGFLQDILKD